MYKYHEVVDFIADGILVLAATTSNEDLTPEGLAAQVAIRNGDEDAVRETCEPDFRRFLPKMRLAAGKLQEQANRLSRVILEAP